MTTTLIVRDAVFAINGAPEKRGEPHSHLAARIAEVARMEAQAIEDCVEVLSSVAGGEGADPEVLEALVVVGLALPDMAADLKLSTLETGRKLAVRLEREADTARALAVLDVLAQRFQGDESLERERAQLLSRQGTVKDLTERYFERAKHLLREGRKSEAAGWLREVLQLDPTRKDARRMLRDLRYKGGARRKVRTGGLVPLALIAALGAGGYLEFQRERTLLHAYEALPKAIEGDLSSQRKRLAEVEQFVEAHPVWHGAFRAVAERSELRVQVSVLEEQESQTLQLEERAERERLEAAELLRRKGVMQFQSGDVPGALEAFRQALERGGPEWEQYQTVSRDVADIEAAFPQHR